MKVRVLWVPPAERNLKPGHVYDLADGEHLIKADEAEAVDADVEAEADPRPVEQADGDSDAEAAPAPAKPARAKK